MEGTRVEGVLRDFMKWEMPEVWRRTVLEDGVKWRLILWGVKLGLEELLTSEAGIVY